MSSNHCGSLWKRLFWICLLVSMGMLFYSNFSGLNSPFINPRFGGSYYIHSFNSTVGYLVYTPGCKIPDTGLYEADGKKHYEKISPIKCGKEPPIIESTLDSIIFRKEYLPLYGVDVQRRNVSCCYQEIIRSKDFLNMQVDDLYKISSTCIPLDEGAVVSSEFIRVKCTELAKNSTFIDYHAFVPQKNEAEDEDQASEDDKVSVLLLGLDGVSRQNAHRQMPKTLKLLSEDPNAIEMFGYNKVADNTFPNIVPVFTGLSEKELKHRCWLSRYEFLDDCPWLWDSYQKAGYRTLLGEDSPYIGMFNFEKVGFQQQPTDYYLRPFMKALEKELGHTSTPSCYLCAGKRLILDILLDYVRKFTASLSQKHYFGMIWSTSLTHDNLNYAQTVDVPLMSALLELKSSGHLNNTILILLSDHGIRTGPFRSTYQGKVEERLPLLFIILPDWFSRRYSKAVRNLKVNSHRLTTPYDLHETLKDLLNLKRIDNGAIGSDRSHLSKGISLFEPVPNERTCPDAGIHPQWCTCQTFKDLPVDSASSLKAARVLVEYINTLLAPYKQCSQLKLHNIHEIKEGTSLEHVVGSLSKQQSFLSLTIETLPGNGVFEAFVKHDPSTNTYKALSEISRINRYGNQSICINDAEMKLLCYCE